MSEIDASAIGPADLLLDGFVGYLRHERGVTVLTVDAYVVDVGRFLADRGEGELSGLTATEVSKAVLGQVGEPLAGLGAAFRVRAAFVPALLLSRRPGRTATCRQPRCRCRGGDGRCCPRASLPTQSRSLLGACDRRRASRST